MIMKKAPDIYIIVETQKPFILAVFPVVNYCTQYLIKKSQIFFKKYVDN
jgi:hypothetical protein